MSSKMPVELQQSMRADVASWVVRHAVFPIWLRHDHPAYARYAREFETTQYLPRPALEELQRDRLRRLLEHAYARCPFYRRRMDEVGLSPGGRTWLDTFSSLRLLTKRDIQEHGAELQAADFPAKAWVRNQTGGSTGSPLQFYVDRERLDSRMASTLRHNRWAGLRPGDWQAQLWGARLDQPSLKSWWDRCRNDLLYRVVFLNTSSIREEGWLEFILHLREKRPRVLIAYAQSAALFARYLRQKGIDDIQFDSVITTAEVLLPEHRASIEETFRAKVFNRYGCREVSIIASECEFHRGMHVSAEALLVEVVPDPALPAPAGRVVVTDLLNFSMPLIRYSIGDVGMWAKNQDCPCGRGLPLLADVQGRTTDFLTLSDGRRISGPALTLVVADMPQVQQVQFVQTAADAILLRVVPGRNYGTDTAEELCRRLGLYLGPRTRLRIELTESIASEASGKYRFAINEYNRNAT